MKAAIRELTKTLCAALALAVVSGLGFGQARNRLLDWHPLPVHVDNRINGQPTDWQPLQLIEITSSGRSITCGHPFVGGTDWLRGLSFKIRNVSGKTIKFIRIYIELPEAKLHGNMFAFALEYGKETSNGVKLSYGPERLLPGAEAELMLSPAIYDHFSELLAKENGNANFTKAFIGMTYVRLDDGMIWDGYRLPSG